MPKPNSYKQASGPCRLVLFNMNYRESTIQTKWLTTMHLPMIATNKGRSKEIQNRELVVNWIRFWTVVWSPTGNRVSMMSRKLAGDQLWSWKKVYEVGDRMAAAVYWQNSLYQSFGWFHCKVSPGILTCRNQLGARSIPLVMLLLITFHTESWEGSPHRYLHKQLNTLGLTCIKAPITSAISRDLIAMVFKETTFWTSPWCHWDEASPLRQAQLISKWGRSTTT